MSDHDDCDERVEILNERLEEATAQRDALTELVRELVEALETELLCVSLCHRTADNGDGRDPGDVIARTDLIARARRALEGK